MSRRKKISLVSHPKRVIKDNKKIVDKDIVELMGAYIFLLASCLLLVQILDNFKVTILYVDTTYKMLMFPVLFFITNAITKKFGFRSATKSIVIATFAGFIFSAFLNILLLNKIDVFITLGDLIGFLVAMFINLSIYYYLLINTKMTVFPIIATYTFSLLINNLTSMLFKYNMIYSEFFWQEYLILIIVQLILVLPLSVIDNKIKRGI